MHQDVPVSKCYTDLIVSDLVSLLFIAIYFASLCHTKNNL